MRSEAWGIFWGGLLCGVILLYAVGGAAALEGNEAAVFVGNDVDWGRNPHALRGIADSTKCEEIREVKKSGGLFRKRAAGQDWHGESARRKAAPTRRGKRSRPCLQ